MAETITIPEAMRQAGAFHQAGNLVDAERLCRAILDLQPDHFAALHLLGVIEHQRGNQDQAIRLIDKALAIKPDYARAFFVRGNILGVLKRREEALEAYNKAVAIRPGFVEALNNRGIVLSELKRRQEAVESFDKALAIMPKYAEALYNRGRVLGTLNYQRDALESFDKALAIKPRYAEALNNRGAALRKLRHISDAIASFEQSLTIRPNPTCQSNLIFALNFVPAATAARQQTERTRWNELYAQRFTAMARPPNNDPDPYRRLRIGYVSSHFRHQAATYAFGGVVLCHDPTDFEVVCYSDTSDEDEVTAQLRARADKWHRTLALSDDEFAELVRDDGIDILVDCVGHMGGHRLLVFARKPAPIQVTAWGEPTGTGLQAIDYLLADPVLVPKSERALLAEQVYDLPNFLGYWVPDSLPEPVALPAIANGYVTFGSFNRLAKLQDPVLHSWAAMLRALPNARLVIKGDLRQAESGVAEAIFDVFGQEGIGRERVKLLGHSDRADHFKAYQSIDIALDPFPHGGGMTTLDALWMGVPVVTWSGGTISSRLAAASLTTLGLTDFVAADLENYIRLAVGKATDLDALAQLRSGLRRRVADSVIGDSILYARKVERAYRDMWQRWCTHGGAGRSSASY
jgi:protein O-GlcNAc transferase